LNGSVYLLFIDQESAKQNSSSNTSRPTSMMAFTVHQTILK